MVKSFQNRREGKAKAFVLGTPFYWEEGKEMSLKVHILFQQGKLSLCLQRKELIHAGMLEYLGFTVANMKSRATLFHKGNQGGSSCESHFVCACRFVDIPIGSCLFSGPIL